MLTESLGVNFFLFVVIYFSITPGNVNTVTAELTRFFNSNSRSQFTMRTNFLNRSFALFNLSGIAKTLLFSSCENKFSRLLNVD